METRYKETISRHECDEIIGRIMNLVKEIESVENSKEYAPLLARLMKKIPKNKTYKHLIPEKVKA